MIQGSCHCGKVTIQIAALNPAVTACNCSVCHRLGALWAYYTNSEVTFTAGAGETATYVRQGEGMGDLAFHHCPACGCTTHWSSLNPSVDRMGINARLLERSLLDGVRVRHLDGADTWTYLE